MNQCAGWSWYGPSAEPCGCDAVGRVLKTVDVSGFPALMALQVACAGPGAAGAYIIGTLWTREREGARAPVQLSSKPQLAQTAEPDVVIAAARDALLEALRHELFEQFKVDGKRVFDPHPPAPLVTMTVGFSPAPPPEPAAEAPPPPSRRRSIPAQQAWATMTVNGHELPGFVRAVKRSMRLDKRPAKRFNRQR